MMISKLINIEETETIIWIIWLKMCGYEVFTVNGDEMHSPVDAININDTYLMLVLLIGDCWW